MRIISGQHRGRRLHTPPGNRVRPTSDMVREALYDVLPDPEGWNVLDLFAGSGAVGVEALSRGAASATFVDNNRKALKSLQQNIDAITAKTEHGVHVHEANLPGGLSHVGADSVRYDMVFIDPPYSETVRQSDILLDSLVPFMAPDGHVVIEGSVRDSDKLGSLIDERDEWKLLETRRYGDTAICIGQRV